jgi:hypothetical protein
LFLVGQEIFLGYCQSCLFSPCTFCLAAPGDIAVTNNNTFDGGIMGKVVGDNIDYTMRTVFMSDT